MVRFPITYALAALLLVPAAAAGADAPAAPTPVALTAGEQTFVNAVKTKLDALYPTPAAAEKAGYVRYTNEDETGAISYATTGSWDSTSEAKPSQLWYDVHGRLLGADYSMLADRRPAPPSLFGISASRFFQEAAHVHYVLRKADGTLVYSRALGTKTYAATGLDPMHPTPAGLVKAGVVSAPSQVATVFLFPHVWDVEVWVVPNPAGPFADANPNVKPSKKPDAGDMQ